MLIVLAGGFTAVVSFLIIGFEFFKFVIDLVDMILKIYSDDHQQDKGDDSDHPGRFFKERLKERHVLKWYFLSGSKMPWPTPGMQVSGVYKDVDGCRQMCRHLPPAP